MSRVPFVLLVAAVIAAVVFIALSVLVGDGMLLLAGILVELVLLIAVTVLRE